MAEKFNIEENIKTLEEMVNQAESGQLSIDDLLQIHSKSVKIIKKCKEELEQVKQRIIEHEN